MSVRVKPPRSEQPKHQDADVWYKLDWSSYLTQIGSSVTLSSATWTVPADLTNENDQLADSSTSAQIKISGGVDGATYHLKCAVVLSDGQEDVGYLRITCSDDPNYPA